MEQKYRIYGKVLLKNAGYTRITRTTCPSLPRFYKILWTRWMDGWMDGCSLIWDLEQSEKRSGLLPHLRFLFHYSRTKDGGRKSLLPRLFPSSNGIDWISIGKFFVRIFPWSKKKTSLFFLKFNFCRLSDFFYFSLLNISSYFFNIYFHMKIFHSI